MNLRIAIKVAYLNTLDFVHGFQIQPDVETIFSLLQKAVIKCEFLSTENEKVDYAGRTDHGVNAISQIIAINVNESFDKVPDRFLQRINSYLPDNIRCWSYAIVSKDFHPRFDAVSRTYQYIYTKRNNEVLNLQLMQEAVNHLIGRHNFINFAKKNEKIDNYEREIKELVVEPYEEQIIFTLIAKSFLWQQCRRIAAHLIQIGKEQVPIEFTKELLLNKEPITKPTPLPPENLILSEIKYQNIEFTDDLSVKLKIMQNLNEQIYESKTKENFLNFFKQVFNG